MGVYSNARDIDPDSGAKRPPLPEGDYPELMIERCQEFDAKDPAKRGAHYYKADLEVLVDTPQAKAGLGGTFLVQDGGNKYRDHDVKGIGQVKAYLGAAFGMAEKSLIKAAIAEPEILGSCAGEGKSLAGHVVAAKVTHSTTADGNTICNFEFRPVLNAAGTGPKVVDPVTKQPVNGPARPVAATAAAPAHNPPPPPPPAPAAPQRPVLPAGWAWHTDPTYAAQGWAYELANTGNMRQIL